MANVRWVGLAQARRGQRVFVPRNVTPGSQFFMRIGSQTFDYTLPADREIGLASTSDIQQEVVDGLIARVGDTFGGGADSVTVQSSTYLGEPCLLFTGASDGAPLDVDCYANNPSDKTIKIARLQGGQSSEKRRVRIDFPLTMVSGNWVLLVTRSSGSVVNTFAYNASAATIQAELDSDLGSGKIVVTGSYTTGFEFAIDESLQNESVELIASSTDCDGDYGVEYWLERVDASPENQVYDVGALDGRTDTYYRFNYGSIGSTHLVSGASGASAIENALESLLGDGNVSVIQNADRTFTVTLIGDLRKYPGQSLGVVNLTDSSLTVDVVQRETPTDIEDEYPWIVRARFKRANYGVSGSLGLTCLSGNTTVFNASVRTNVETGDWSVWAGAGSPHVNVGGITFGESRYELLVPVASPAVRVVFNVSSVVGFSPILLREVQPYRAALNEIQQIQINGDPTGGSYTLTFDGETTVSILDDADSSDVLAALEDLSSIGSGNVEVLESSTSPFTVIFKGSLGASARPLIEVDTNSLTLPTGVTFASFELSIPTGPNWWTNAANWSNGAVPTSSDLVIFDNGSIDCLYGISGIAAIQGIDVYLTYTGAIGLANSRDDGRPETLPRYVTIGSTSGTTAVRVGLGDSGSGPSRVRLNCGAQSATVVVFGTTQPVDSNSTVQIDGTAISTVQVLSGSVGFGFDNAATIATLTAQTSTDQGELALALGSNASVTTLRASNCSMRLFSVPSNLDVRACDLVVYGAGTLRSLTALDSTIRYWATGAFGQQGTITVIAISSGLLRITSNGHGLASGDVVYVVGLGAYSVPDGFYTVSRVDANNFDLLLSAPTLPFGVSSGTLDTYYNDTAKWGKSSAIDLRGNTSLTFGVASAARTSVSPIVLRSAESSVLDPMNTLDDLRLQLLPGGLSAIFGDNTIISRA